MCQSQSFWVRWVDGEFNGNVKMKLQLKTAVKAKKGIQELAVNNSLLILNHDLQ